VLVGVDGRIASRVAGGADAIRALVTATLPERTMPWALAMGQIPVQTPEGRVVGRQAPAFVLPDLDGQNVDMARFRGHEALLVFWNPACGYCQQMVPALRNWQGRRSERDPALVVISRGSVEAIQAMGLESLVLLDTEASIASSFGATGTPMAVLLDADGRVASTVATGAQEVMALAGRNRHRPLADARSDR
ncbi:MAG: peroxiredoxin family protein, partial [Acidimicrobiales bacterium]